MDKHGLAIVIKDAIEAEPGILWKNPDQVYWDEERGGLHTGVEGLINCTAVADAVLKALGAPQ